MSEFYIGWLVYGFGFWGGSWLAIPTAHRYQIGFLGMLIGCVLTTLLWPMAIYERKKYPTGFWVTGGGYE